MSVFKKYPKIHRLGKEETEGILIGDCHIEEKIDGANVSIWLDKRGEITCGSRNKELSEGFNGFVDWVKGSQGVKDFFRDNPTLRLYGEWLVRHTIAYVETNYKQFYLFDITEAKDGEENEEFFTKEQVLEMGKKYGFKTPTYHGVLSNPTPEDIDKFVGLSSLGEKGEGVVIKNLLFRDKFGNQGYAKVVTQEFKENNGITFGSNSKHSDTYNEMYVVNKYMTLARIEKIMHKIQPEIETRLDFKDIPRVSNSAYYDMLTEEIWEIASKVQTINFNALKRLSLAKAIQIYKDVLTGDISVADRQN